jgi:hypothetical protein
VRRGLDGKFAQRNDRQQQQLYRPEVGRACMFKNLTPGQWAVFIVLTCMTVFGGLLYLAAEAYFNRKDQAFAATPAGAAHLERETANAAARTDAQPVEPTIETNVSFWNSEISAPKAALILAGVALAGLLLLNAGHSPGHPVQVREPVVARAPAPAELERCRAKSTEERWAYLELKKRLADGTLTTSERVAAKIATGNYEIDLIGC